jgi:hypothetical protein
MSTASWFVGLLVACCLLVPSSAGAWRAFSDNESWLGALSGRSVLWTLSKTGVVKVQSFGFMKALTLNDGNSFHTVSSPTIAIGICNVWIRVVSDQTVNDITTGFDGEFHLLPAFAWIVLVLSIVYVIANYASQSTAQRGHRLNN